jgi:hypothetical protein
VAVPPVHHGENLFPFHDVLADGHRRRQPGSLRYGPFHSGSNFTPSKMTFPPRP